MTDPKPARTCPKGHKVMKRFGTHRCSVEQCGEDKQKQFGSNVVNLDEQAKIDPKDLAVNSRHQLAGIPKGLKGDDAVKWAQEKMVELLPEAVANISWNLRYGTDKQRDEATDRVLRANGMDRKDAGSGGSHGLIVLNLGTGAVQDVPWLQRMRSPQQTVQAVTGSDDETERD